VVVNYRNREPQEMLDAMLRWVRWEPTHAGYFSLARTYYHFGMPEEGLEAFRHAVQLKPAPVGRTHDQYILMGMTLHGHGAYEESIEAYRLALREKADSAVAHNNICAACNSLERWREARQACEEALTLEPDLVQAANNLQVALEGLGLRQKP
jgi:tetratricopeptide (TPR) repeat protein